MKFNNLKSALVVLALTTSAAVNAGVIEYEIFGLSNYANSNKSNTYNGQGFVGAYENSFGGLFCVEGLYCRSSLQVDVSGLLSLNNLAINSAFLYFDILDGSNGRQNVTVTGYNSDGVLRHYYNTPGNIHQQIFTVSKALNNKLDVTSFLNASIDNSNNWFGLHLQGTTGQWTYVNGGYSKDRANVRLVVDYDTVDVPEPSTLAVFALGMIGLASRRFKKKS